ncbi:MULTISPECIES: lipoate--protein ligase [Clostridium]|uniref:lipoate--protein ligase n=1 Tax=Clostridium senegalense TaxID=1465809 RepID=A0A6M0H6H6_9CLOT|nr:MULTISPECIES: lipoate--protein ligase [Clostridium]NEU05938.1 lipoate--protein ligase [Clostridium senegalense]
MIFINHNNINPYFNHSAEEYILKTLDNDCFMLWQNEPCILIGRNQNAFAEINEDYVSNNNIKVVRRLTGGGAVFNDLGNINFSFISQNTGDVTSNFKKFTLPIIKSLHSLGIDAKFSGRNDLVIDEKKFSGNAQYYYKNKVLHHGTLLFSSSIVNLSSALNVNPLKFKHKSVSSVKSRVTNISDYLKENMTVLNFKNYVLNFVMNEFNEKKLYFFDDTALKEINNIMNTRFATHEWNFGKNSKYKYSKEKRFSGGTIEVNFNIEKGIIKDLKFYGDFFFTRNIEYLESKLIDKPYNSTILSAVLNSFNIEDYIKGISNKDLINLMF